MTAQEAHKRLSGTVSSEKNEILFSQFGVNYNTLDPIYKRGSIILWEPEPKEISTNAQEQAKPETAEDVQSFVSSACTVSNVLLADVSLQPRGKHSKASKASAKLVLVHEDMLKDSWWTDVRPYVLPKA
jgi:tRNA(His) guanylyltransferase